MKKFKKFSALLMASVITASAVSSMSAGAIDTGIFERFGFNSVTKEDLKKFFEDAYMIPADSVVSPSSLAKDTNVFKLFGNSRMYLQKREKGYFFDICEIEWARPDYISASLESGIDADALISAMKEICPDAEVVKITPSDNENDTDILNVCVKGMDDSENWRLPCDEVINKDVTYDQVIKIYDLLNETDKLKSFEYTQVPVICKYTIDSCIQYTENIDKPGETIQKYIEENDLDWTIRGNTYYSLVIPATGERTTAEEALKISEQIYNDLGIYPIIPFLANGVIADDVVIDLHNNIKGDANDDGELRLSDAIMILQSIGNPDEYQLTPQGRYNADIYGDRDGITTMDAVTVQRKILGLE